MAAAVRRVAATLLVYTVDRVKHRFLVKILLVGAGWGTVPLGVGAYHGRPLTPAVLTLAAWTTVVPTTGASVV